jgi:hypothetical protein
VAVDEEEFHEREERLGMDGTIAMRNGRKKAQKA